MSLLVGLVMSALLVFIGRCVFLYRQDCSKSLFPKKALEIAFRSVRLGVALFMISPFLAPLVIAIKDSIKDENDGEVISELISLTD